MMKSFKRIASIFLTILIIFVVLVFVFLQVRQYSSKKQLVHKESSAILKIAIDDILQDFVINGLFDLSFKSQDSSSRLQKIKDWELGIDLPANLYFFSLDSSKTSLYSYQKINDEKLFIKQILKLCRADSSELHRKDGVWSFQSSNGKINLIGDSNNVLINLNYFHKTNSSILQHIWNNRHDNMQEIKLVKALNELELNNTIDYINVHNKDHLYINLFKGKLLGQLEIDSLPLQKAHSKVRYFNKEDILTGFINIKPNQFNTAYNILNSFLGLKDSFSKELPSYIDLQWKKGTVIQQDTVITYEYDENFEAKEVKTLQKSEIPNLSFTLKNNDLKLSEILFYKFHSTVLGPFTEWHTSSTTPSTIDLTTSNNFLEIHYNQDPSVYYILDRFPLLKEIQSTEIKGYMKDNHSSVFTVELKLIDNTKHPLSLLF